MFTLFENINFLLCLGTLCVCVCVCREGGGGKGVGKGNWMAANSNDIVFCTYMLVVLLVVACVLPKVAWSRGFKCRYNGGVV